jgi:hypothetical protein
MFIKKAPLQVRVFFSLKPRRREVSAKVGRQACLKHKGEVLTTSAPMVKANLVEMHRYRNAFVHKNFNQISRCIQLTEQLTALLSFTPQGKQGNLLVT